MPDISISHISETFTGVACLPERNNKAWIVQNAGDATGIRTCTGAVKGGQ